LGSADKKLRCHTPANLNLHMHIPANEGRCMTTTFIQRSWMIGQRGVVPGGFGVANKV